MFSFKRTATPAVAAITATLILSAGVFAGEAADAKAKPASQNAVAKEQADSSANGQVAVVKVNGQVITRQEVDRAMKVMLAQNQVQEPLSPEARKEAETAVIDQLTAAELLYQEAAKLKIPDLDKLVDEKVAQNRARFKSEQDFLDALKSVDMTMQDMQEFTRKDILINNFIEKTFVAKAVTTEDDARKFYDQNIDRFKKEEAVRASHILVGADQKASPEERKKAKEKADALLKRVKAGEDFAAIAKAESSCPSANQGGDLGPIGRGQTVPAFENAAFGLKPGEMSGVVETEFGYHIIKVVEKQEPSTEKFDTVKEKIENFLKQQKVQQDLTKFIDELKKTAKIEKN